MKLPTCYCPHSLLNEGVSIFFEEASYHNLAFLKQVTSILSSLQLVFTTPGGKKLKALCLEENFAVRRMKKRGWYFTAVILTSLSIRISCKINSHLFYTIYLFPQQQAAVKVHRVLPSFFGNSASARRFQFH
jgi:hypothetical protein